MPSLHLLFSFTSKWILLSSYRTFSTTPYLPYIGGWYRRAWKNLNVGSQRTISYRASKDLILVHTVQLKQGRQCFTFIKREFRESLTRYQSMYGFNVEFHPLILILAFTSPESSRYTLHKHLQPQNIVFQVYTHILWSSKAVEVHFCQPH